MVDLTMEVMHDDAGQLREPCGYLVRTCIQGEGIAHAKVLRWGMPNFFKKQQGGQWGRQRKSRWEGHSGRDRLMLSRGVRWWRSGEQHEGAGAQVWLKVLVFPPILKRPPVFAGESSGELVRTLLWYFGPGTLACVSMWLGVSICVSLSLVSPVSWGFLPCFLPHLHSLCLQFFWSYWYIWFILLSKILFK